MNEVVYPPIEAPPLAEPVTQEEIVRYKVYTVRPMLQQIQAPPFGGEVVYPPLLG